MKKKMIFHLLLSSIGLILIGISLGKDIAEATIKINMPYHLTITIICVTIFFITNMISTKKVVQFIAKHENEEEIEELTKLDVEREAEKNKPVKIDKGFKYIFDNDFKYLKDGYYIGVDIAKFNKDRTILTIAKLNENNQLHFLVTKQLEKGLDNSQLEKEVDDFVDKFFKYNK